jgi:hypothetical protein
MPPSLERDLISQLFQAFGEVRRRLFGVSVIEVLLSQFPVFQVQLSQQRIDHRHQGVGHGD